MADNVVARDLMVRQFEQIRSDDSLAAALDALVAVQDSEATPNALIVTTADGDYAGILTARLLAKSLLALWMPEKSVREDDARLAAELHEVVRDRLQMRVRDALIRGIPCAGADDRLLRLIEIACDKRLEFVAVAEGERVIGIVPVTAIFQAAVGLALTPEHEGIRFDQPD